MHGSHAINVTIQINLIDLLGVVGGALAAITLLTQDKCNLDAYTNTPVTE